MKPPMELQGLQALPPAPGVYIFLGQDDEVLYIGKSINLRRRVADHLRAPGSRRMLERARRVRHVRTAGDIGAQLLEARLVKQQLPVFNIRLRRHRRLLGITLPGDTPEIRNVHALGDATAYGVFASRFAAQALLRTLADAHGLCCSVLGLEPSTAGQPCFRYRLGRCAGACCGQLPMQEHRRRLHEALRAHHRRVWPYAGGIGIVEQCEGLRQIHVIRNWAYLGSVDTLARAAALSRPEVAFDLDGYQILVGPILRASVEILPL